MPANCFFKYTAKSSSRGVPHFGINGPARPEWYYGLTRKRWWYVWCYITMLNIIILRKINNNNTDSSCCYHYSTLYAFLARRSPKKMLFKRNIMRWIQNVKYRFYDRLTTDVMFWNNLANAFTQFLLSN